MGLQMHNKNILQNMAFMPFKGLPSTFFFIFIFWIRVVLGWQKKDKQLKFMNLKIKKDPPEPIRWPFEEAWLIQLSSRHRFFSVNATYHISNFSCMVIDKQLKLCQGVVVLPRIARIRSSSSIRSYFWAIRIGYC